VAAASIPPDDEPALLGPEGCSAQFFEELLLPPPPQHGYTIQPKDFAFTRGFVDQSSNRYALHLFYIRHSYYNIPEDDNEKNIGHAWTTDFNAWHGPTPEDKPDTVALTVRQGKFDELHVWAPSIVQLGPKFYMFYTGVRNEQGKRHQRIGVATSYDLDTWTPADTVVLSAPDVPWARKDPPDPYFGAQQLRDAFVMEDPVHPGQYLMYFVAVDSSLLTAPKMAVGAARSSDLLHWTAFEKPFSGTEKPTFLGGTNAVESPHVFSRNGQWWLPYTVNLDQVFFETTTGTDPADTIAAHWTAPVWLRGVAEARPAELQYWHATEYLRIGSTEYLAAYNDNATSIDIKGIFAPSSPESALVDSFLLYCPETAPVAVDDHPVNGVQLVVSRLRPGSAEVGLRLELPSRMPLKLAVYDIAGRRRSTLLDRELPGGVTEVTWDGRDQSGVRMASGVYFVRLTCASGARVTKIVMLR
jgi:predicted GH43/DUF377 family glycosyl hydrolase